MQLNKMLGALAGTCCLWGVGCGTHEHSADLSHDIDKPVRSEAPWNWYVADNVQQSELFYQQILLSSREPTLKYVDADHPLTKGVTKVLDSIDESLRRSFTPEQMTIPKPQVLLKVDDVPNASVVPAPVCFTGFQIDLSSKHERPRPTDKVFLSWDGEFRDFGNNGCKATVIAPEQMPAFVAWLNENLVRCRAYLNGSSLSFDETCTRDKGLGHSFSQLAVYVTGPAVVVNSGLVSQFSREQLLSILAHELGHYYRSHATAAKEGGDYNFFYTMPADGNAPNRPKPDAALKSIGEKVRAVRIPNRLYRRVPKQVWDSEFFLPIQSIVKTIDTLQDCSDPKRPCHLACAEAAAWLNIPSTQKALDGFPFRKLLPEQEGVYFEFERYVSACVNGVIISDDGNERGFSLSKSAFKDALSQDHELYTKVFIQIQAGQSVTSSLAMAKDALAQHLQALYEPLQQARDQRLGFYTFEQEADELSLEWMDELGFRSTHAISAELVYAALREQRELAKGLGFFPYYVFQSRCEDLLKRQWKDEAGVPQLVPIVDYADPHHSSCFRAYNLSREAVAHASHYKSNDISELEALKALPISLGEYQSLQAEAEALKADPSDARINYFKGLAFSPEIPDSRGFFACQIAL